jgi:release factor glutamine methyltransferase
MTIAAVVADAALRLAAAGVAEPRREARLLTALALGVDPAIVLGYPERAIDESARERLGSLLIRRAAREPLSRIRGNREFWSLPFLLSPDTLDPRPDSETVIEAALDRLPDRGRPLRVLDLGTGTGCLLLALLSELPHATGVGTDLSAGAAAVARRNAAALGLADRAVFLVSDWDRGICSEADVILSNPPYISSQEIDRLAPEVARYEPRLALDGGIDGLDAYRRLSRTAARLLGPKGFAVFEIGAGQAEPVGRIMQDAHLAVAAVRRDLAGTARCLVVERSATADRSA